MIWKEVFHVTVQGIPRPGGSKTSQAIYRNGKPVMSHAGRVITTTREAGKHTPAWRQDVKAAAAAAWGNRPLLDEPLQLTVVFTMPRPKSHYRTGKHAGELRADAPQYHTSAPDATKLLRSLEDACTLTVWRDDSRICDQHATKVYGERPGAEVTISVPAANGEPAPAAELFAGGR